ncbi:MAG TPA: ABC transporter ATP-binding protein, partial [Desulfobacterales bacterium]|nr:ABC transporter ATP-binding protein [Desulfobacterales bacterium]
MLEVEDLRVAFGLPSGAGEAVRGVSFELDRGEILGLVGETGSGKTLTGLSLLRLVSPPGRVTAQRLVFEGLDLLDLGPSALRATRGTRISMIFQDPATSLNPVFTIGAQLDAVLTAHTTLGRRERRARATERLAEAGLPDPDRIYGLYPHQLSGGMQQRAMIALALAGDPELLVADEPTTALDVTIQAQMLELLRRLRAERGLSIILISHHLGVVRETCDRVALMYAGSIVEEGSTSRVLDEPRHPYTISLLESVVTTERRKQSLVVLPGLGPAPGLLPPGCSFAPRCPSA